MPLNQDIAFNLDVNVSGQQAVDKLSDSLRRMGQQGEASAKQTAAAMRMVPAQLTDIATQLAGGQSPFLVMLQQGGQLRDSFGSVTGALSGVGRTLTSLLTPTTAAVAALAAVGFAAYKGWEESVTLEKQLLLTGGAAGYTAGQIEQLSRKLAAVQDVSAGSARDITTGLAATGQFVGKNLDEAAAAAAKLQKLSGQSADEIVKDFARMSAGVASWAAERNRQMNFLTLAQFQQIKALEEAGKKEEAMAATLDAFNGVLEKRQRQLGLIERTWNNVGKAASAAWRAMLNIGAEESKEDKLTRLQKQLAALEQIKPEDRPTNSMSGVVPSASAFEAKKKQLREQIAELQNIVDDAQKTEAERAADAAKIRQQVEDEQSGKANALRTANIQLELSQLQGASQARIALLEQEGQRNENLYRSGLISESKFYEERDRIAQAALAERKAQIDREIALEMKRPTNGPAGDVQRDARVQALRNQAGQLSAEATQAQLKAEEERIARLSALRQAERQKRIAELQGETESTIAELERQGQRIENQYKAGITTEERYQYEKLRIAKAVLNERLKLTEQEIGLEQSRTVPGDAEGVQRDARVQQLRNQAARLREEATKAELRSDGERAAFTRQMTEEVQKFARAQDANIDRIRLEADAMSMSTLERQKHAEALRIDREAADAAKGKAPEYIDAINREAAAKKAATMAALEYADAKSRDMRSGAAQAFNEYADSATRAATQAKAAISNAFKGMEDALVDFVKTGKLDFKSLADSIIADMARIVIQQRIMGPLAQMMGSMFGPSDIAYGNTTFASAVAQGTAPAMANGGIVGPSGEMPLHRYATGGVANSPQMAIFGEGRMPEAYVPLPDGRSIPVSFKGAAESAAQTTTLQNITVQAAAPDNGKFPQMLDALREVVQAGYALVAGALERIRIPSPTVVMAAPGAAQAAKAAAPVARMSMGGVMPQPAQPAQVSAFANGGIMTSAGSLPLNAYSSGGVATRPQMALFGEGRTPEAFVPLPDGRTIPVTIQGAPTPAVQQIKVEADPQRQQAAPVLARLAPVIVQAAAALVQVAPAVADAAPIIKQAAPVVQQASPAIVQAVQAIAQAAPAIVQVAPAVAQAAPVVMQGAAATPAAPPSAVQAAQSVTQFADNRVMLAAPAPAMPAPMPGTQAARIAAPIAPLPDARVPAAAPAAAPAASKGDVTVNVVNNASGAQATTQERQDGNGNRIIDVMIEQVKASIASDISRGVGTVTSALERTYGANRAAGAY